MSKLYTLLSGALALMRGFVLCVSNVIGFGQAEKREGIAKCTFKNIIGMSDIVFMRVLRQVEVPRFFSPLSAALEPCDCIVPDNKENVIS